MNRIAWVRTRRAAAPCGAVLLFACLSTAAGCSRAAPAPDAGVADGGAAPATVATPSPPATAPAASAALPPVDASASTDADVDPAPLRCADYGDGKRGAGCGEFPADVLAFLDGRAMCEHWRGEPYAEPSELDAADPEARKGLEQRRQQVIDNANQACRGTDATLAALKTAHAGDARVLRLLGGLDAQVE